MLTRALCLAAALLPMAHQVRAVPDETVSGIHLVDNAPVAVSAPQLRPEPPQLVAGPVVSSLPPLPRPFYVPRARWVGHADGEGDMWTMAMLTALGNHPRPLESVIPRDIDRFCPAYAENNDAKRNAFWVGLMSALTRYESTYNPEAVGGGGLWFGLLQIAPPTAQHFDCRATTGEALKLPMANLRCAARIMTHTVRRDNAIALHDGRWRGLAADWGPMRNEAMVDAIASWTREQDYCVSYNMPAPRARPGFIEAMAAPPEG